ncbi:MAG: Mth938-like domain-containing protein [Thiotrichales bacterium]|nr:Mth938-like domain-containing protein [Thiotrichales bacterium]
MKFSEHRDSNVKIVKHYQPGEVKINADFYRSSLYLTQHQVFSDWPVTDISQLAPSDLDSLLALKPEVILLGTGEQQRFPAPAFFQYCAKHGVGLEVMANDAACRTFNVIGTEDREVILALIFAAPSTQ